MTQVLIVDDEQGIRNLLSEILSDEGYAVCTAEDASHAREMVRSTKIDLILLDIWMPDTELHRFRSTARHRWSFITERMGSHQSD